MNAVVKAWVVAACAVALGGGSCDRVARKHPLTLDVVVFDFHQAIRAGKYEEAATFMAPQWREPFLKSWRRGATLATVHELEVTSVKRDDDADYARVEAAMRYLVTDSLVEHTFTMFELWKGEGKTWYLDALVEGPPEFHEGQAQQWVPPPGEAAPQ